MRRKRGSSWVVEVYDPIKGQKVHVKPADYEMAPPRNEREAIRLEAKAMERLAQRRPGRKDETCDSFGNRWVDDFPVGRLGVPRDEPTKVLYREKTRRFVKEFEGRTLRSIDRQEARKWANDNPSLVQIIRSMFYDAMEDELVESNPFAKLGGKRSRGRQDIVVLTPEEIESLCELAKKIHGDEYGPEGAALIKWGAYTLMRPSEIYVARFSRLGKDTYYVGEQFNSKTRTIREPKYGSVGDVYVPSEAREAVLSKPRRINDDLIFRTKRGKQLTQTSLHRFWDPIRAAFLTSLPDHHEMRIFMERKPDYKFVFYELRHFGAHHMLHELGLEPWIVAEQLRHKDGGRLVTQLYGHPNRRKAINKIRSAYGENIEPIRRSDGLSDARTA